MSADFSKELTTAVMWPNSHDVDDRCVRLRPYGLDGRVLMDVQQVIPLPEAAEYQVPVKEKTQKVRKSRQSGIDFTRYDITIRGKSYPAQWKRRAILRVAQALAEGGVEPEQVAELIAWRSNRIWWKVDGDVDSETFINRAAQDASAARKTFDIRRWFGEGDELVHYGGRTYAFSNQMGNSYARHHEGVG